MCAVCERHGPNPADFSDAAYAAYLWNGDHPTRAEVRALATARQRHHDAQERAALIARWRAAHPDATCADSVAFMLADLERCFAPGRVA